MIFSRQYPMDNKSAHESARLLIEQALADYLGVEDNWMTGDFVDGNLYIKYYADSKYVYHDSTGRNHNNVVHSKLNFSKTQPSVRVGLPSLSCPVCGGDINREGKLLCGYCN
jgi:hypothetical protein